MDKMRELANAIVETFEEVLDRYDVTLPSSEDDEREQGNTARLYGMTYYGLLDAVEALIADYRKEVKHPLREVSRQRKRIFLPRFLRGRTGGVKNTNGEEFCQDITQKVG